MFLNIFQSFRPSSSSNEYDTAHPKIYCKEKMVVLKYLSQQQQIIGNGRQFNSKEPTDQSVQLVLSAVLLVKVRFI